MSRREGTVSLSIGVVDHGVGNVVAILNLLRKIGVDHVRITSPDQMATMNKVSTKIIIPGVGSFDTGMRALRSAGLDQSIKTFADSGGSVLGICLGMQLLFQKSEEGNSDGLNLVAGSIVKMREHDQFKVPHVGWEPIIKTIPDSIFEGIPRLSFYHNHSYAALSPSEHEIAKIEYDLEYTVAVRNRNVVGVQFHPEKSHSAGERLMVNFVNSKQEIK
jgi:glutamine amidotransferase